MTKRIRAVPGGTRASKTFSIVLILIDLAMTDKEQTLTSIVSESFPHLKRGAMRDFLNIIKGLEIYKDSEWNKTDKIYTFNTGSQIEFFSVDQPDKMRGAGRNRLFINEANNVKFDAFEQLEVRTEDFIFLDWNPSSEFWFYDEVMPPDKRIDKDGKPKDDVEVLTVTYLDNEALSENIRSSIEARRNRKGWWKVYGLGQLGELEGKIYSGWQIIDDIPHEAKLVVRGLDFGFTNDPSALIDIYEYNGGFIFDERLYQHGMHNKPIANFIKSLEDPQMLVVADSAEPKSIDEILNYGINIVGVVKGKDSVKHGIEFVQEQKVSVTKRSVKIIKEYRNYLFMVDKNGKVLNTPEKTNDHCMDCLVEGTKIKTSKGDIPIEKIKKNDLVYTRKGLKKVKDAWLVKKDAKVIQIKLSNGYSLVGTANHKIWTQNRGWQYLTDIRYDDIMEVWKQQEYTTRKNIIPIQTQNNPHIENIFILGQSFCIGKYGKIILEKFQKIFTYIIRMVILLITALKTLSLLTKESTVKLLGTIASPLKGNVIVAENRLNVIHCERQTDFVQTNVKASGVEITSWMMLKEYANNVKKLSNPISMLKSDFVPVRVVEKTELEELKTVYDLTVEDQNEYFANNILVHNSIRYALSVYKPVRKLKEIEVRGGDRPLTSGLLEKEF